MEWPLVIIIILIWNILQHNVYKEKCSKIIIKIQFKIWKQKYSSLIVNVSQDGRLQSFESLMNSLHITSRIQFEHLELERN